MKSAARFPRNLDMKQSIIDDGSNTAEPARVHCYSPSSGRAGGRPGPSRLRIQLVGAVNRFALRCLATQVDFCDRTCAPERMIICERCATENLNGSRYCDECGAALWLAGKSGGLSLPGAKKNGSDNGGSKDASATVAQAAVKRSAPLISEQQTSLPPVGSGTIAHATLVIERGNSAGKQFPFEQPGRQYWPLGCGWRGLSRC